MSKERVKERAAATVIEGMLEAVAIIDLDGTIHQVNSEFERGLGWKREEAIGKTPIELGIISKEEVQKIEKEVMPKLMKESFVRNIEIIVIRRDGTKFPALMNWTLMKDAEGKPTGIITVASDITEFKKLQKGRETAADTIEAMRDGVILIDMTGKLVSVNPALEKMLDLEKGELVGTDAADLASKVVKPEDVERFMGHFKGTMEGKVQPPLPITLVSKDGRKVPVACTVSFIKGAEGKPTNFIVTIKDITEFKRAKDALRESEKRFRNLVETTSDWVWEVDENAVYTYVSPKIRDLLGYEPEEVLGKTPFDLMPPEEAKRVAGIFGSIATSQKPFKSLENMNLHKDGHPVVLETSGVPIFDKDGTFRGYHGIDRDITERKRAEEEKSKILHDLKERMKELNCLYKLAKIVEIPNVSLEEIFHKTVDTIPLAWQYPDITCARIIVEGREFKPTNFKKTKWKQSADIREGGKKVGVVEVYYLEEKPEINEGPFLKDEGNLIEMIAERLGRITERKRAEEALRESEERYRALFESSADGIIIADIQTREFKYANPAICRMLGYSEEELKRMGVDDIHPKDKLEHVISEFEAQARGEKTLAPNIPCLRKDGTIAYADINTTNALIGGKECAIGFFRDITELKRAEEIIKSLRDVGVAIQKTMDEETIFNIVGRGLDKLGLRPTIYMLDEGKKNANIKRNVLPPAALAFAERLVGLKLNGFSIPVDKVPAFRDVVREQKTVVLHNPAETIGQFLVSGEPSRKKQAAKLAGLFGTESAICSPLVVKGKVVGIFTVCSKHLVGGETATIVNTFAYQMGTAIENARLYEEVKQELAKRNRAEEEIGKLRTPVAGIDIGDLEPKLVYLNDAFAEMHGYSANELIGKKVAILHNNEQIGEFEEVIHKIKTQGSWKGEIVHVKKDSTTFPVYMSATLLKNEKIKPIEILAVCRDITKRKEAEVQIEAG